MPKYTVLKSSVCLQQKHQTYDLFRSLSILPTSFTRAMWVIICEVSQGLEVTILELNETLQKCLSTLETEI